MAEPDPRTLPLGARPHDAGCRFTVWAPRADRIEVVLDGRRAATYPMEHLDDGYATVDVADAGPGDRYWLHLDGDRQRADPASRFQPDGVGGPSAVVDPRWPWHDDGWRGVELDDLVLYELHVGTYTTAGTFDAVIAHLDHLRRLGVTAIELMPIAQFPGARNWGYDGVGLYAVQNSYGGPDGLRRLVDAAHVAGLGVLLDVVYNHLGPEGNHLTEFGPYFTDRYHTPWGSAVNVDGAGSDDVRRFFIENALMWVADYHLDGLRLDAVHAIADASASPFLEELTAAVHACGETLGRRVHVIAEDGNNDPRLTRRRAAGGQGLDAQWNDDFHHALHVALTGERQGYYRDFSGIDDVATAMRDGFVYGNRRSVHRDHRVGRAVSDADPRRLVVFAQNHDQIGNRAVGDRLVSHVGHRAARTAALLVMSSPSIPLLFMGEEWAEPAPFQYFVDHADPRLLRAVRDGRRAEFAAFGWHDDVPDPADAATFERSRVDHARRDDAVGAATVEWYRAVLTLRRDIGPHRDAATVERHGNVLAVVVHGKEDDVVLVANLGAATAVAPVTLPAGRWSVVLDNRASPQHDGGESRSAIESHDSPADIELAGWAAVALKRVESGSRLLNSEESEDW